MNKIEEPWIYIRLGNDRYFDIINSGINYFDNKKEYLSTSSIKYTAIKNIESSITYNERPSRANMQPILNSVWFAKMKDTLKVYSFTEKNKEEISKYIMSTGFTGIECKENVDTNYLFQYLLSDQFNSIKNKLSKGSTQKAVSNSEINSVRIPVPPLVEQWGIVEVLGTVDECIRLTEAVIEGAEELKQGLMQQLLTRGIGHTEYKETQLGVIPDTWRILKLGKVLKLCQYGLSYPMFDEGKYPIFRMNNFDNGIINDKDINT